jgi:hypothetical protein
MDIAGSRVVSVTGGDGDRWPERPAHATESGLSLFEYVIVLLSVVLSLGIARVLESHAHLLKRGADVRWSPTYILWLVIILACHVDLWASLWMVRTAASWSMGSLLVVLMGATSLFYAAVLSAPDLEPGRPIDLWAFHLENRRRYLGAVIAYLILGAVINMTLLAGHFDWATFGGALPSVGLALAAIFISNRRVQIVAPILLAILMVIYFASYFPTLQG